MATQYHNPSLPTNLYSSGAVRFDNRQFNQMLYEDQKRREAQRAAEAKALQDEYQSNVSKIRDADIPDYTSLYQAGKSLKKDLLFDKKLQKDLPRFQEKQMEYAKIQWQMNKLVNASKQDREDAEFMRKDWLTHGENYDDDFATLLSARNKLPLSRLSQVDLGEMDEKGQKKYRDLSNWDAFRYKGIDYDPTKLLNTAQGAEMKREFDEGAADKTGLQNKITTYQFHGSSPMQYRDTILGGMLGDRKANKYFQYQLKNTTPEEIERVNKEFANIPDSVWKQWGVNKQELTQSAPDNKSEMVANYLAKKYAIDNLPKAIKTDLRTNESVKLKMNRDWDLYLEGIKQKNRERLKMMKGAGDGEDDGTYDIVETAWKEAQNNPRIYESADGNRKQTYEINGSPEMKKLFAVTYDTKNGKVTLEPNAFQFSKDGKYITPIFYSDEKPSSTGKRGVMTQFSQPILTDFLRATEGKKNFGVKENKSIMQGASKKSTPSQKYSLGGKSYTHKQLNDMDYSDEEIEQAIKAGIIK